MNRLTPQDVRELLHEFLGDLDNPDTDPFDTIIPKIDKLYKDRELRAIKLSPLAEIAMMTARLQLERGENPPINTTATLLAELEDIKAELRSL